MFAEARKSEMDLEALGSQMAARKAELEDESADDGNMTPFRRSQVNAGWWADS